MSLGTHTRRVHRSGALDFLTKPVKAKELVERVKSVLWTLDLTT